VQSADWNQKVTDVTGTAARSNSGQTPPGANPAPAVKLTPQNGGPELTPNNTQVRPEVETAPTPRAMENTTPDPTRVAPIPHDAHDPHDPHHPHHPQVAVAPNVPNELKPVTMPTYIVGPPDILQIDSLEGLLTQPVRGPHLIRPDGTVGIGAYGSAYVAGLTIDQAREAIARVVHARLDPKAKTLEDVIKGLSVDVLAYNSKVYYVITDRVGFGEIVLRVPITGNETVLDAISQLNGLPPEAAKRHIWVARRCPDGHQENILPVDWVGITQKGYTATNYQILPGDRVYVRADCFITANYVISKFLAPFERILGVTLLGSQTVNSIRGTTP
jgi:polysaccharide export outer membrane protein